jgi:hypothetical protein
MAQQNVPMGTTRTWIVRGLGAVGMVLLASVPALGLTVLSPGLFSAPPSGAEASPTAPEVAVSWTPLAFDAPTTTLERMKAAEPGTRARVSDGATAKAEEIVLSDWRFTQYYHRHDGFDFGGFGGFGTSTGVSSLDAFFLQEILLLQQEILLLENLVLQIQSQNQHHHRRRGSHHH